MQWSMVNKTLHRKLKIEQQDPIVLSVLRFTASDDDFGIFKYI